MNKILEISKPPITSFFNTDIPLTILYDNPDTHPWIFSNYIQLYSTKNVSEHVVNCFIDFHQGIHDGFRFLELSNCPWLLFERISIKDVRLKWGDTLSFVKEKINDGKYIAITVDSKYISHYDFDMLHNLFVYGYDDDEMVLYTADHFKNGLYDFKKVSYKEFEHAVSYPWQDELDWGHLEGICVLSKIKRDHKHIYDLNIKKIVYDLMCYNKMEGYIFREDDSYSFGLDCYDNLIKYYNLVSLESRSFCSLKGIMVESEHKKMMLNRLDFLRNYKIKIDNSIFVTYKELFDNLSVCKFLIHKYNLRNEKKCLERTISLLKSMKEQESEVNTHLINNLLNQNLPNYIKPS